MGSSVDTRSARPGHFCPIHGAERDEGEFLIDTVAGCHVFGQVVRSVRGREAAVGAEVAARLDTRAEDAARMLSPVVDEAMAALLRVRAFVHRAAPTAVPPARITRSGHFPSVVPEPPAFDRGHVDPGRRTRGVGPQQSGRPPRIPIRV